MLQSWIRFSLLVSCYRLLLLCLATACATPALAQRASDRYAGDPAYTMADLSFGHVESDIRLDDEDSDRAFDNDYFIISLMSEFAPHTLGGLRFIYADGAPEGRDVVQGVNPSGYGLGFGFSGKYPLRPERVFFIADGHYQYVDTSGSNDSQKTTYEWWSLLARVGASLRLGRFELGGGAAYRTVDGEERTRGDVDRSTDFDIDRNDSAFFELDFSTDPNGKGHVGLLLESGGTEQLRFYFRSFF